MAARIGTSGWSYDHWHPELYPSGLPPRSRLGRYSAVFPTAELNSSFYRWPAPAAFRSWRDRLPDGFRLSVKAPRGLTHARKLYAPETWLQRIGDGWHELGDKRAVLLVQLPPAQPRDDTRLAYFLRLVPDWIRVAVEFRHDSWHCEETFALPGQDVYVYFNNDGNANAVRNARTLHALLAPDGVSHPVTHSDGFGSSHAASSNSELRAQRDVDHVRKVRVGPRTHQDKRLTCEYAVGRHSSALAPGCFRRSRPWGFKSGLGCGVVKTRSRRTVLS